MSEVGILQYKCYCMTVQESTHWAGVELPKTTLLQLLAKVNTVTLQFASFFTFCVKQLLPSAVFLKQWVTQLSGWGSERKTHKLTFQPMQCSALSPPERQLIVSLAFSSCQHFREINPSTAGLEYYIRALLCSSEQELQEPFFLSDSWQVGSLGSATSSVFIF